MSVFKEISLVIAHEFKHVLLSLRSVLFFIVYGGLSFLVGSSYTKIVSFIDEKVGKQPGAVSSEDLANSGMSATKVFTDIFEKNPDLVSVFGGQHVADALTSGRLPVVIWVLLGLSGWFLPSLLLIVGYDRISQDLNSKFSRFIFLRLRRGSYLCGKILAQWLVAIILVGIAHLLLLLLVSNHPNISVKDILASAPTIWLGMTLYLLAYISFTAVFSASFTPPFTALALGLIAFMGFGVASILNAVSAIWMGDHALPILDAVSAIWMGDDALQLWVGAPVPYVIYIAHIILLGGIAFLRLRTREI